MKSTEKVRRWRINNPIKYAYICIKSSAKRRGIDFSLTLEQFETFCTSTGYLERKGRTRDSLSIDRIDEYKGYEDGNIQVLTVGENKKKWLNRKYPKYVKLPGDPF